MQRFMQCYRLTDGKFEQVQNPAFANEEDWDEGLRAAGYSQQASSRIDSGAGSEFALYATNEAKYPAYLIEIMGKEHSLAYLVADDFPRLLATLRELQPLLSLFGLDQQSWIEAGRELWREKRERFEADR